MFNISWFILKMLKYKQEAMRCKRFFGMYYLQKMLLLKEFTQGVANVAVLMKVNMEEFSLAIAFLKFIFGRKPQKYLLKPKFGVKQEKLPLENKLC